MPRYKLLFSALLKVTSPDDPTRRDLEVALQQVAAVGADRARPRRVRWQHSELLAQPTR